MDNHVTIDEELMDRIVASEISPAEIETTCRRALESEVYGREVLRKDSQDPILTVRRLRQERKTCEVQSYGWGLHDGDADLHKMPYKEFKYVAGHQAKPVKDASTSWQILATTEPWFYTKWIVPHLGERQGQADFQENYYLMGWADAVFGFWHRHKGAILQDDEEDEKLVHPRRANPSSRGRA